MDGIPWQVVTPIATAVTGGLVWLGKKIWTLVENHAERRTKGIEAIAPSIKQTFDEMRKHVTDHAEDHAKAVEKAESNIITAVNTARASIVEQIGFAKRLERVEAAVMPTVGEEPTSPERSDPRPSRPAAPTAPRDSRLAAVTR